MRKLIVRINDIVMFVALAIRHNIPIWFWRYAWKEAREGHEYQINRVVNMLVDEGKLIRTVDAQGNLWVKDPKNPNDPNSAKRMVLVRFEEINQRRDRYND